MRKFNFKKAEFVHESKYDYSKVVYKNVETKVIIICPIHGEFEQTPYKHINCKQGCPSCRGKRIANSKKADINDLIERSNIIHGKKYDYSKVVYTNMHTKVCIICPLHGEFFQNFNNHLLNKNGCPSCGFNVSKSGTEWLDKIGVPHKFREKHLKIDKNTFFKVDALDRKNKIVYEYFGNFWHGNPDYFKPTDINPKNGVPFGVLYQKTLEKIRILEENGYKVIYSWGN